MTSVLDDLIGKITNRDALATSGVDLGDTASHDTATDYSNVFDVCQFHRCFQKSGLGGTLRDVSRSDNVLREGCQ